MPQHAGPFAIANAAETLARGAAMKLWWETATCSRVPVEMCKSTSFCEYSEILVPVWNMLHVGTHCEIERFWKIAIWIRNQEQNSYTPHHDAQQRVRQHMRQKRSPQHFTAECCRYIMIYHDISDFWADFQVTVFCPCCSFIFETSAHIHMQNDQTEQTTTEFCGWSLSGRRKKRRSSTF